MFGIGSNELQEKKVRREEKRSWPSVELFQKRWAVDLRLLCVTTALEWSLSTLTAMNCDYFAMISVLSPLADTEFHNKWRYITLYICTQHLVQCLGIQRHVINFCWMNEWMNQSINERMNDDWLLNMGSPESLTDKLALVDDSILDCVRLQYLQATQIPTLETANFTFKGLMTMYVFIFFNTWLFFN